MLVYDVQALQSAAHGRRGIGRYVFQLARALRDEFPHAVDVFAWNDRLPRSEQLDRLDLGDRLVAASALAGESVDVLHVTSPFEMTHYELFAVPVEARRLVVTCYDLIPYRFADAYLTDRRASARYRTRLGLLASADAIVTDSHSAANDLAELVDLDRRRLTVIGAGVGDEFVPADDDEAARMSRLARDIATLRPRFVLTPTGMDWRKNAAGAIRAYGRLPDDVRARHQLVLPSDVQPGYEAWLRMLADEAGITNDQLVITGYVSEETLVALYQTADLVFFPTFYEGFGLPVLEAINCGARVIASSVSSLPEVVGDKRALFDPHDIDAMTHHLASALADPTVGARGGSADEARFTWPRTAGRLVDVYDRMRASIGPRSRSA